jgi:drug/metabolite transporter (DMT)-like permease
VTITIPTSVLYTVIFVAALVAVFAQRLGPFRWLGGAVLCGFVAVEAASRDNNDLTLVAVIGGALALLCFLHGLLRPGKKP